ncbi:MAG: alanyl-tRNA editing protein [Eubacteriales bacterium]|nr:alanyl-tRNA editing protein [Eubacteriales bacterium]
MNTKKLYYGSAYIKEFDAEVTSCVQDKKSWLVELNETAFYPEGGGQPADAGRLYIFADTAARTDSACDKNSAANADAADFVAPAGASITVTDVHEKDGRILHYCDKPLEPGTKVRGVIDWERRFDHMQQHSGEHIVSGMICSRFNCDNVGFHMGKGIVTIDYNADITFEELKVLEEKANRYIWENHEFVELWPDEEELKALDYRSKKELTGEVRITSFPGADMCACCGTHVRASGEVGLVKFISCQKFTKGTRIELLCGKRALDFLSMNFEQNAVIAKSMAASLDKTAAVHSKQKEELIALKIRCAELETLHFEAVAREYENKGDVLIFKPGLSPDSVRKLCVLLAASCKGRAAVFSSSEKDFKYAVCKEGADIREFIKEMNSALGGRGGGKDGFAQGSVSASEKEIREFFDK